MGKRVVLVYFLLLSFFVKLCAQIFLLPRSIDAPVAPYQQFIADRSRGQIWDRHNRPLVMTDRQWVAVLPPGPRAETVLAELREEPERTALKSQLQRGLPLLLPLETKQANNFRATARERVFFLETAPRYANRQLAPHLIGHLDGQTGRGATGLERAFEEILGETPGVIGVRMSTNGRQHGLIGTELELFQEQYPPKFGIRLTLDAAIQQLTEDALIEGGVEQGAAVVLDCATSEILALASAPAFHPSRLAADLNNESLPFFNRALGAYPIGSTFKCFIAAAALSQALSPELPFVCHGELYFSGKSYRCNNYKAHGEVDLAKAISQSCNLYFIQMSQRLQKQPLLDLIHAFGFGGTTQLAPGIQSAAGNIPERAYLEYPAELANLSFGQGKLLGSPLQMAVATACIANGGTYNAPKLVFETFDTQGNGTLFAQESETRQVLHPWIATQLRDMMIQAVEEGTGRSAKPDNGRAGGKTATAQTGAFAAGREILQTSFTGFFPAEEPRYAITVMRENGTSGAADCGPVFAKIANQLP